MSHPSALQYITQHGAIPPQDLHSIKPEYQDRDNYATATATSLKLAVPLPYTAAIQEYSSLLQSSAQQLSIKLLGRKSVSKFNRKTHSGSSFNTGNCFVVLPTSTDSNDSNTAAMGRHRYRPHGSLSDITLLSRTFGIRLASVCALITRPTLPIQLPAAKYYSSSGVQAIIHIDHVTLPPSCSSFALLLEFDIDVYLRIAQTWGRLRQISSILRFHPTLDHSAAFCNDLIFLPINVPDVTHLRRSEAKAHLVSLSELGNLKSVGDIRAEGIERPAADALGLERDVVTGSLVKIISRTSSLLEGKTPAPSILRHPNGSTPQVVVVKLNTQAFQV
ncbi:hypothetical protein DFH08DRAFT_818806 [Mycena albidolilacea]|uniref:Uncharacterized protein n=1 Tax=Mycena albidolilacea TaxID=1033008 RepID=A0AAD6ZGQ6_9AGAR|nr:hypothetical protein DFH08DRAFT_818806 [Mycena albidolilacea]